MYNWFYSKLKVKNKFAEGPIYLLDNEEIANIKRREKVSVFWAAVVGALAVLALYLPQYYFPELFPLQTFQIPFLADPFEFSIVAFVYGLVLVFVEIWILTFLNIYSAHKIAVLTGYLNEDNKNTPEKRNMLLSLGQEKKTKEIKSLGIDPYFGLNKYSVFAMTTFFTLKATLSNMVMRLLIQKIMGRYAVREVLDMLGMPIFAFWNAVGTRKVLRQARVVLMGMNYLNHLKNDLVGYRNLSNQEKILLYDTLLFIAMSKRDFHKNHYLLAKMILEHFEIPVEKRHVVSENHYELVAQSASDFKELNEKIILVGFALDGSLSNREKRRVKNLKELNIIQKTLAEVEIMVKNFVYGRGLF